MGKGYFFLLTTLHGVGRNMVRVQKCMFFFWPENPDFGPKIRFLIWDPDFCQGGPLWGHRLPVTALALSASRPFGPARFARGLGKCDFISWCIIDNLLLWNNTPSSWGVPWSDHIRWKLVPVSILKLGLEHRRRFRLWCFQLSNLHMQAVKSFSCTPFGLWANLISLWRESKWAISPQFSIRRHPLSKLS